jgi:hypothetical protein
MVAGLAGGLAGAWMMNRFQELASGIRGGREASGAAPGEPREGRGPQPAQAAGDASNDATARLASVASELTLGRPLARDARVRAGSAVHFAFGAGAGMTYGLVGEAWPVATAGLGIPFGLAVWALADEGLVPALGLSRDPRRLAAPVLFYGLLSHVIYGATTDAVRRMIRSAATGAHRR